MTNQTDIINITDCIPSRTKDLVCMFWSQYALKQRECPLVSPPPFYELKGLVSVCISLNFFVMYTWTTIGFLLNGIWKIYCTCLKFNQNIIILFWFSCEFWWNLYHYAIRVYILCCARKNKTNGTVTETWILPFCFYSTFPWARETIKSNEKLNTSIKKYPTPPVSPKYHLWKLVTSIY